VRQVSLEGIATRTLALGPQMGHRSIAEWLTSACSAIMSRWIVCYVLKVMTALKLFVQHSLDLTESVAVAKAAIGRVPMGSR
jgi:hypothetical protein